MITDRDRQPTRPVQSTGEGIEPVQFASRALVDSMPEKQLLLAVIEEAAATYRTERGRSGFRSQRLFREARLWIESNATDTAFTFRSVCDALGLDHTWVRRTITAEPQPQPQPQRRVA